MRASSTLIQAIKKFEGVSLSAYQDSKGVWTIGYGRTKDVKKGEKRNASRIFEKPSLFYADLILKMKI